VQLHESGENWIVLAMKQSKLILFEKSMSVFWTIKNSETLVVPIQIKIWHFYHFLECIWYARGYINDKDM